MSINGRRKYFSWTEIRLISRLLCVKNLINRIFSSLQLLQNLGKVDRTADEIFDEHLTNFNRQQTNANRLQKEFNNYIRCIRGNCDFIHICQTSRNDYN